MQKNIIPNQIVLPDKKEARFLFETRRRRTIAAPLRRFAGGHKSTKGGAFTVRLHFTDSRWN